MRKAMYYMIFMIIVLIAGILFILSINPLVKAPEKIREDVLKVTPLGTAMFDTIKTIDQQENWRIIECHMQSGIPEYTYLGENITEKSERGEKYFKGIIGRYTFHPMLNIYAFADKYVECYWVFDKECRLVEVYVVKVVSGF